MKAIFDFSKEKDKRRLFDLLKKLKPVKYDFEIKQFRKKRSVQQNRYYWGVIIKLLCEHTGFFPDEMHELLRRKFMPVTKTIRQTGEQVIVGKSTTENDTADQEIYHEMIRTWALTELDVLIPLPNEQVEAGP